MSLSLIGNVLQRVAVSRWAKQWRDGGCAGLCAVVATHSTYAAKQNIIHGSHGSRYPHPHLGIWMWKERNKVLKYRLMQCIYPHTHIPFFYGWEMHTESACKGCFQTTEEAQKSVASYLMLGLQLSSHFVDCVPAVSCKLEEQLPFLRPHLYLSPCNVNFNTLRSYCRFCASLLPGVWVDILIAVATEKLDWYPGWRGTDSNFLGYD